MDAEEREKVRRSIIEGCRDMNDILLEMAQEWEAADDELWRSFEPEITPIDQPDVDMTRG